MVDFKKRLITSGDMLEVGKAAEHLVCFDLMIQGYRAYLSDQGLPYDVLVDLGGTFVRIQVKSTLKAKNANAKGKAPNTIYQFYARSRGKNRKGTRLSEEHCDIVAFVAIDIRQIAYVPIKVCPQTLGLYPPGYVFGGQGKKSRYERIHELPFGGALEQWLSLRAA
ncbi:MAG: hypothetical protein PHS57_08770 [Alphaproteobacteria bacterium]|nr:hypothetical protein [Alphaproteobacteria bacterium]